MIAQEQLDRIVERFHTLEQELAGGASGEAFVRKSKEYSELAPLAKTVEKLRAMRRERAALEDMLADPEMAELARADLERLEAEEPALERALKLLLLPKDEADAKSAILEIRAGTGGEEAALFAGSLLRMYQRYAQLHRWRFDLLSLSESDRGGVREAAAEVNGAGVFARLKFESGVHRVQRVPETEASGRIHTSAATVAVLPEAEEVDVDIQDKDLRIDVYRSQGAGGQHVNTTDSAVRITHLPTGMVVACQDGKSQHKNKAQAMKLLRAKLYEAQREAQDSARAADRKAQVGSGDRSERIRTYNFPQGRATDHRIGLTLYKLEQVLSGEALDEIVEALIAEDQSRRLAAMEGAA